MQNTNSDFSQNTLKYIEHIYKFPFLQGNLEKKGVQNVLANTVYNWDRVDRHEAFANFMTYEKYRFNWLVTMIQSKM